VVDSFSVSDRKVDYYSSKVFIRAIYIYIGDEEERRKEDEPKAATLKSSAGRPSASSGASLDFALGSVSSLGVRLVLPSHLSFCKGLIARVFASSHVAI
jgi:hypothetical protein